MPGTYTLRPIQANLTHDTDWLGKMDPYCAYRVGPSVIKGPICRNGGKFPKWEDAAINVPATNQNALVVDLMDKDKFLFDDNIGSFVIDLQEVQSRGQISKWYPVYWRQKPAGEILMEAAFQPEIVQQPIIEPVLVKEVVVEPVIVEKIVEERIVEQPVVVQQPTITQVHKEFVSGGPVIQGISTIHHGGEGYGLVPQHGQALSHGQHIQQGSTLVQGGSHFSGSALNQGYYQGTNQGNFIHSENYQGGSTLNQGLNQGSLNQGTYQGGSTLNQGLNQGSLNQGLNQGSLNQGGRTNL